jgi:hypothetical protein
MKRTFFVRLVAAAAAILFGSESAEELITYPDGSTAWRGANGNVWGRAGGRSSAQRDSSPRSISNGMDVQTGRTFSRSGRDLIGNDGRRYESNGAGGVVDPWSGRTIPTY